MRVFVPGGVSILKTVWNTQKLLKVAFILLLKMWFLLGVPTGTVLYSYFNYNISFITIKDLILLKHSVCENKNKAVWYNENFFFFFQIENLF